jgi:dephospho-CoA kinase
MKRALLTGMSGTGKSTLICAFSARGYKAIDTDTDEWSEWSDATVDANDPDAGLEPDWIWRVAPMQQLLSADDADILFVSGCKSNQGQFYPLFDHIILLSAPTDLLIERLATRTNNPYGKQPHELARILSEIETVEPLLRRRATAEIDTSAPVDQIVETILRLVRS